MGKNKEKDFGRISRGAGFADFVPDLSPAGFQKWKTWEKRKGEPMDRNKRRVRYMTSASAGGGTYRMGRTKQKKAKKWNPQRIIRFFAAVLAALLLFHFGRRLIDRERGRTSIGRVTRIGATLSQNVSPFSGSVIFYDGTTLHCVSASGGNEWSYQIGTNADYDATDRRVVAWSGNDLYILNERGRLIYNNKMSDTVQFASAGEEYVAVFSGDADEGVVTVINENGQTVDNIPVSNQTLIDIGFFRAQTTSSGARQTELMWMMGLNTTGTVLSTELQTFQPGRLSIGKRSVGDHIAYSVYDDGAGNLEVVTTREVLYYNYRLVEQGNSTLIYGYSLQDVRRSGGVTYRLLIPAQEQTGNMTIDSVRLMYGQIDRMAHLPVSCMDVRLGSRAVYGFSKNALYACRFGETTFQSYSMPIAITSVLGMLTENRAVVASGSEIYVMELPL